MSIAWGSLVLLVALLPGILFFIGTYLPEQFTREVEPQNPLGQLGGALLVSIATHGVLYVILGYWCGVRFPCVDLRAFLEIVTFDPSNAHRADQIASAVFLNRGWILFYILGTSATGVLLGWSYGKLTSTGKIRGLSRHAWVYDLSVDGLTYAHILTTVRQGENVLLYKGYLRAFGMRSDGHFSYIVLSEVTRLYLRLTSDGIVTSGHTAQHVIGKSNSGTKINNRAIPGIRRLPSYFVIEGEDIANVVFDMLEFPRDKRTDLDEIYRIMLEEAISDHLNRHEVSQSEILAFAKDEALRLKMNISDEEIIEVVSYKRRQL